MKEFISRNIFVFSIVILVLSVLLGGTAAQAQSALDGFAPSANGTVRVVVVQPDGKILIGGEFTTVSGVTRNRIARINTDGTLDTALTRMRTATSIQSRCSLTGRFSRAAHSATSAGSRALGLPV